MFLGGSAGAAGGGPTGPAAGGPPGPPGAPGFGGTAGPDIIIVPLNFEAAALGLRAVAHATH
jgi:hypothetical protein